MTENSLFDDPEGFIREHNSDPWFRERDHRTATRKRGGLRHLAAKAAQTRFGMPLADLDREACKASPGRAHIKAAHDALRIVAGYDPDHAEHANGLGFARTDVALAHALASASIDAIQSSPAYAALVHELAARYRKQVPARLNLQMSFTEQTDFFD
jgi:hypothetical protein